MTFDPDAELAHLTPELVEDAFQTGMEAAPGTLAWHGLVVAVGCAARNVPAEEFAAVMEAWYRQVAGAVAEHAARRDGRPPLSLVPPVGPDEGDVGD